MKRLAAVLVALCMPLALASCGSGGDSPTGAKSSTADAQSGQNGRRPSAGTPGVAATGGQALVDAQVELARCMRRQGIDFPDPKPGRGFEFDPASAGIDEARVEQAEKKCARYVQAIADAAPKPSKEELERDRDAVLDFARCMRKQGQDVPDPTPAEEGTAVAVPPDAKTNPAFLRASRKCEGLLRDSGP